MRLVTVAGVIFGIAGACSKSGIVPPPSPTAVTSGPAAWPNRLFPIGVYVNCADENLRTLAEGGFRTGLRSHADQGFAPQNGYDPDKAHFLLDVAVEPVKECEGVVAVSTNLYSVCDASAEKNLRSLYNVGEIWLMGKGKKVRRNLPQFPYRQQTLGSCRIAELDDYSKAMGTEMLSGIASIQYHLDHPLPSDWPGGR